MHCNQKIYLKWKIFLNDKHLGLEVTEEKNINLEIWPVFDTNSFW